MAKDNGYNPLDKANLGKSVVDALLESEEVPLLNLDKFFGAGIYALYYRGDFEPYDVLASRNRKRGEIPIYVGKAIPKGGRKGVSSGISTPTDALFKRLIEHRSSIEAADSLDVGSFSCRKLIVDDIWIALGESLIIDRFKPLWNTVVEGFGNHNPGSGRFNGRRPLWDEIHPGRAWALKCSPPKLSSDEIFSLVGDYMKNLSARGG